VKGRRAVFLDRDGVINEAVIRAGRPHPPRDADSLRILPGVVESLRLLKQHGFTLVVVTNQPDIARGATTAQEVAEIGQRLAEALPLDEIAVCPHDDSDGCGCRKPKPGLLIDAARRLDIDLSASFLVGDRWRDIGAAQAAGVRPVFIDHQYDERRPDGAFVTATDLVEAARLIIDLAPALPAKEEPDA
jgi:D-glycero-D-manno-heptose 1,7-bisphosphate phosphatase